MAYWDDFLFGTPKPKEEDDLSLFDSIFKENVTPSPSAVSNAVQTASSPSKAPSLDEFLFGTKTPSVQTSTPKTPTTDSFEDLKKKGLWGDQYGTPVGTGVTIGGGGQSPTPSYLVTGSPQTPSVSSPVPTRRPAVTTDQSSPLTIDELRAQVPLPNKMDTSTRENNLAQWAPALEWVGARTGLAPEAIAAIILAENGGGQSHYSKDFNNYFSLHAFKGSRATSDDGIVGNYANPIDNLMDFIDIVSTAPNYAEAWNNRADPEKFWKGLVSGGYIQPDGPIDTWVANLKNGADQYRKASSQFVDATTQNITGQFHQTAEAAIQGTAQAIKTGNLTGITPSQAALSDPDKWSLCGPVAAMAFAARVGRPITEQEAKQLAIEVGWTAKDGMAGPTSEVAMLKKMGIAAKFETAIDWNKVAAEVRSGNPVIINSPGHYFVVEGYDAQTGKFDFGASAKDVWAEAQGGSWFKPEDLPRLGGLKYDTTPRGVIYMDNPGSPAPSPVAGRSENRLTTTQGSAGVAPTPIQANVGNRPVTLYDIAMGKWEKPLSPVAPPPPMQVQAPQATTSYNPSSSPVAQQAIKDAQQRQKAPEPTAPTGPTQEDLDAEKTSYDQYIDAFKQYQEQNDRIKAYNLQLAQEYEQSHGSTENTPGFVGPGLTPPTYAELPAPPEPPATPLIDAAIGRANQASRDEFNTTAAAGEEVGMSRTDAPEHIPTLRELKEGARMDAEVARSIPAQVTKYAETARGQSRAATLRPNINDQRDQVAANADFPTEGAGGAAVKITVATPDGGSAQLRTNADIDALPEPPRLTRDQLEQYMAENPGKTMEQAGNEINSYWYGPSSGYFTREQKHNLRNQLVEETTSGAARSAQREIGSRTPGSFELQKPSDQDIAQDPDASLNTVVGRINSILGTGMQSSIRGVGAAISMIGSQTNSDLLVQAGATIQRNAIEENRHPRVDPRSMNTTEQTIGSVGPMLATIGLGLATRGVSLGLGASVETANLATMSSAAVATFAQEAGEAYSDQRDAGISPNQAAASATVRGIINAGIEFLPIGEGIAKGLKLAKGAIPSARAAALADKLNATTAGRALLTAVQSSPTAVTSELITNAFTEGGQEALQELVAIATEQSSYNRNWDSVQKGITASVTGEDVSGDEVAQQIKDRLQGSAVGGALLGGGAGVVSTGASHILGPGENEAVQSAMTPFTSGMTRGGTTASGLQAQPLQPTAQAFVVKDANGVILTQAPNISDSEIYEAIKGRDPGSFTIESTQVQQGANEAPIPAAPGAASTPTTSQDGIDLSDIVVSNARDSQGNFVYNENNLQTPELSSGNVDFEQDILSTATPIQTSLTGQEALTANALHAFRGMAEIEHRYVSLNADQRAAILEAYGVEDPNHREMIARAARHVTQNPQDVLPIVRALRSTMASSTPTATMLNETFLHEKAQNQPRTPVQPLPPSGVGGASATPPSPASPVTPAIVARPPSHSASGTGPTTPQGRKFYSETPTVQPGDTSHGHGMLVSNQPFGQGQEINLGNHSQWNIVDADARDNNSRYGSVQGAAIKRIQTEFGSTGTATAQKSAFGVKLKQIQAANKHRALTMGDIFQAMTEQFGPQFAANVAQDAGIHGLELGTSTLIFPHATQAPVAPTVGAPPGVPPGMQLLPPTTVGGATPPAITPTAPTAPTAPTQNSWSGKILNGQEKLDDYPGLRDAMSAGLQDVADPSQLQALEASVTIENAALVYENVYGDVQDGIDAMAEDTGIAGVKIGNKTYSPSQGPLTGPTPPSSPQPPTTVGGAIPTGPRTSPPPVQPALPPPGGTAPPVVTPPTTERILKGSDKARKVGDFYPLQAIRDTISQFVTGNLPSRREERRQLFRNALDSLLSEEGISIDDATIDDVVAALHLMEGINDKAFTPEQIDTILTNSGIHGIENENGDVYYTDGRHRTGTSTPPTAPTRPPAAPTAPSTPTTSSGSIEFIDTSTLPTEYWTEAPEGEQVDTPFGPAHVYNVVQDPENQDSEQVTLNLDGKNLLALDQKVSDNPNLRDKILQGYAGDQEKARDLSKILDANPDMTVRDLIKYVFRDVGEETFDDIIMQSDIDGLVDQTDPTDTIVVLFPHAYDGDVSGTTASPPTTPPSPTAPAPQAGYTPNNQAPTVPTFTPPAMMPPSNNPWENTTLQGTDTLDEYPGLENKLIDGILRQYSTNIHADNKLVNGLNTIKTIKELFELYVDRYGKFIPAMEALKRHGNIDRIEIDGQVYSSAGNVSSVGPTLPPEMAPPRERPVPPLLGNNGVVKGTDMIPHTFITGILKSQFKNGISMWTANPVGYEKFVEILKDVFINDPAGHMTITYNHVQEAAKQVFGEKNYRAALKDLGIHLVTDSPVASPPKRVKNPILPKYPSPQSLRQGQPAPGATISLQDRVADNLPIYNAALKKIIGRATGQQKEILSQRFSSLLYRLAKERDPSGNQLDPNMEDLFIVMTRFTPDEFNKNAKLVFATQDDVKKVFRDNGISVLQGVTKTIDMRPLTNTQAPILTRMIHQFYEKFIEKFYRDFTEDPSSSNYDFVNGAYIGTTPYRFPMAQRGINVLSRGLQLRVIESPAIERFAQNMGDMFDHIQQWVESHGSEFDVHDQKFAGFMTDQSFRGVNRHSVVRGAGSVDTIYFNLHASIMSTIVRASKLGYDIHSDEFKDFFAAQMMTTYVHEILHSLKEQKGLDPTGHGGTHQEFLDKLTKSNGFLQYVSTFADSITPEDFNEIITQSNMMLKEYMGANNANTTTTQSRPDSGDGFGTTGRSDERQRSRSDEGIPNFSTGEELPGSSETLRNREGGISGLSNNAGSNANFGGIDTEERRGNAEVSPELSNNSEIQSLRQVNQLTPQRVPNQLPGFDDKKFSRDARKALKTTAADILANNRAMPMQQVIATSAPQLGMTPRQFGQVIAPHLSDLEAQAIVETLGTVRQQLTAMGTQLAGQPTVTDVQFGNFLKLGLEFSAYYDQLTGKGGKERGSKKFSTSKQKVGETQVEYIQRLSAYAQTPSTNGKTFAQNFIAAHNGIQALGATAHQTNVAWNKALTPKTTFGNWMIGFFYSALLGPATAVTALAGNSLEIAWRGLRDITLTDPRDAKLVLGSEARGAWHGFIRGLEAATQTIRYGATREQTSLGDIHNNRLNNNQLGAFSPVANAVGTGLDVFWGRFFQASDQFAKTMAYSMQMGRAAGLEAKKRGGGRALADRLFDNPTTDMMEDATRVALETVFQGKMGSFGEMLARFQNHSSGVGRVAFPFLRTIYHSVNRGVDRTPIGLIGAAWDLSQGKENGTRPTTERLMDGVMGTAMFALIWSAFAKGLVELTGQPPDDDKEKKLWREKGKIPYGIRIGNSEMFSYANLGPPAYGFAAIAEMQRAIENKHGDLPINVWNTAIRNFGMSAMDMSYMQNLSMIIQAIYDDNTNAKTGAGFDLTRLAENLVTSRIPFGGSLNTIGRGVDPYTRYPTTEFAKDPGKRLAEVIATKMPAYTSNYGLPEWTDRTMMKPALDMWGFPQLNPYSRPDDFRVLGVSPRTIFPARSVAEKNDPVNAELERLLDQDGVNELPATAPNEFMGHSFSSEEKYEWKKRVGQNSYALLSQVIQTPSYLSVPSAGTDSKQSRIDAAYAKARELAFDSMNITDIGKDHPTEPKYVGIQDRANQEGIPWWQLEKEIDVAIARKNAYTDGIKQGRSEREPTRREYELATIYARPSMKNKQIELDREKAKKAANKDIDLSSIPFQAP